jgi:uncharacterized membrane protein
MKNDKNYCRNIVAVIGIAVLMAGVTQTSRGDDVRGFADKSQFTKIDVPGAAGATEPFGINPRGDVVGFYFAVLNNSLVTRGFLLTKGTFKNIDVDVPGAVLGSTQAFGINPQGDIVGFYSDTSFIPHGFLLRKDTFTTIDPPGSTFTVPLGINSQGDIVGAYLDSAGNGHGFLLSNGVFTIVEGNAFPNGINPEGDIVGSYGDGSGMTHGFLLSK